MTSLGLNQNWKPRIVEENSYWRGVLERDRRLDGAFVFAVRSTGIYCRPVCTARTPKEENCRFFKSAAAAEKESFRPCLRCRPELAPGSAPVDDAHRIAGLIAARLEEGLFDDGARMEEIAAQFELSARQVRRIVRKELGVSPMELVRTRRLLLAKQLLTDTALPVTEIAFASGFSSLRRFNDAFSGCYGMPPSRLRKETGMASRGKKPLEAFELRLGYRPPFDWAGILMFLSKRAVKEVERVGEDSYCRTVQIGGHKGWVQIRHVPEKHALTAEFSLSLAPVLHVLLGRLRNLFDLDARPDIVAAHLMRDGLLADAVEQNPGLRVPGAFDGFELAVRAVLGQQITVKAATTLAGRFVEAFGEKIETPYPGLQRLCPAPQRVASAKVDELAVLGIIRSRAASIIRLAEEMSSGRLRLEAGAHPDGTIRQLVALPGIGRWTAHYIAMRALRWPDAFPGDDIALRKSLGGVSAARAEELSQAWRPWRSYATLHLWRNPVRKKDNPG